MAWYKFRASNQYTRKVSGPVPTPNLVFEPSTTQNPVVRFTGAGYPVQKQIKALQPPQVYVAQTWPLAGFGGVSAGMMYGYPLAMNSLGQPLSSPSGNIS